MKLHEAPQAPKEYDRFIGQDHGTRGMYDEWKPNDMYSIDDYKDQQEYITKQEINDGIEDYSSSEFQIPKMRETSDDFEQLQRELAEDELVYTTDVNRLPDDLFEDEDQDQDFEIDDFNSSDYEAQQFSKKALRNRKNRRDMIDYNPEDEDLGDDFPSGMHITNRP